MNKKYTLLLLLLLVATITVAQEGKKKKRAHNFRFYINASADYLPEGGLENNTNGSTGLTTQSTIGGSIGGAFLLQHHLGMFMLAGIDAKHAPRKVVFKYNAADMGYPNSNYNEQSNFDYNKLYLTPYIKLGYMFQLPSKKTGIELGVGINFNLPLNGGNNGGQPEYKYITSSTQKDLAIFQQHRWGNGIAENKIAVPLTHLQYSVQLAYRIYSGLIKNKPMRIGVSFNGQAFPLEKSSVAIFYLDKNRNEIGSSSFLDYNNSFSFFVGFGI